LLRLEREQVGAVIDKLVDLLDIEGGPLKAKIARVGYQSAHPVKLIPDIDQRVIAKVTENQADLPGVSIEPDTIRYYPKNRLIL
jgi:penicillin-binding protein 2